MLVHIIVPGNARIESLSSGATATAIKSTAIIRPPARLFISGEKRSTVLCLLLVLLTLAFYNPIVHNGFTNFDDNGYITDNPHVRAGLTWDTVKWAFTSRDCANWHPVTWLSHAFDCQLFKLNPAGHHYVTVLLHAVNAILLFLLLEGATGFTWPSFMVAALFALHPVNVESVAWAAERKNVLSMLFFLLTLHAYGWYARRVNVKRYAVVAALFALGLMAKPEIITLPFVLLLWDYWPLRRLYSERSPEDLPETPVPRSFSFLLLEKVPLLLLSAGSAVITLVAQRAGQALRGAPAWVRFGNAAVAYVRYLGKAFWPVACGAVSASGPPSSDLGNPDLCRGVAPVHWACPALAGSSLSGSRLVLVPGYVGPGDRPGPGQHAGDGRPLCILTLHWPVCVRDLGGGRDGTGAEDLGCMVRSICSFGLIHPWHGEPSSACILA